MEHFMDILWWALAAGGALIGNFGSQPSPPKLDTAASQRLTKADYELKEQFTPRLTRATGDAARREYRKNLELGLSTLGDASIRRRYEAAMPEATKRRAGLLSAMDAAVGPSAEYQRLQREMQGAVGERAGMLSPEEQRDATQSARAAFAARGLGTSASASAAEILNRNQFVQQRQARDLNILGQSASLAQGEQGRQLGLRGDAYNFQMSSNPNVLAIGAGSPYANFTPQALGLMGGQNVQPMYSGGQFSSGGLAGGLMGGAMGAAGGALTGAALGTTIFPGYGTALGAGLGALGGLTGFMGGSR
jgi:hypothetical protein